MSESTLNCALLVPFAVTSRRSRDVRINQRIDSLPCPALFSMFPGRLVRSARGRTPECRWRGFTKLRRLARPGFTADWIVGVGGVGGGELEVGCGCIGGGIEAVEEE